MFTEDDYTYVIQIRTRGDISLLASARQATGNYARIVFEESARKSLVLRMFRVGPLVWSVSLNCFSPLQRNNNMLAIFEQPNNDDQ